MGSEIDPGSTIPATTGIVLLAANFQKGCYPGQELVETDGLTWRRRTQGAAHRRRRR